MKYFYITMMAVGFLSSYVYLKYEDRQMRQAEAEYMIGLDDEALNEIKQTGDLSWLRK